MGKNEQSKDIVFLVDDNLTNLLSGQQSLAEVYEVYTMNSGMKLFKFLEKKTPELILLDVEMPEMDGFTALRKLKSDSRYSSIPVVMLTAHSEVESELLGFELGATDFITKPFSVPRLLKRVESYIAAAKDKRRLSNFNKELEERVNERTSQLLELQSGILSVLADMVESRDKVTGGHIERTEMYLSVLLHEMARSGLYSDELDRYDFSTLLLSAQLHDIGKISVPDAILNKPSRLTEEEFNIIKLHTSVGEELITKIERKTQSETFLEHAKLFAGYHHEKWDGTGYPYGKSGVEIPLQGRVMAIVDVYDALVSERPYKKPFTHDEAMAIIKGGRGTHFDPMITDCFVAVAEKVNAVRELMKSEEYMEQLRSDVVLYAMAENM